MMSSFAHASEATVRLMVDFPRAAAEKLAASLRAARDLGAWDAHREFKALGLADESFGVDWESTPEAAIRYLQGKTPMDWRKVDGLQDGVLRAKAFWITGVEQQADLEDVLQGLVKAVRSGSTLPEFRKAFGQRLKDQGLNGGQVQAQFRTHTHAAYQQSQAASYQENPLVENLTYVTAGDDAVRPEHAEWEGITLPKDDDFWDDHTPPNGWNCRCVLRVSTDDDKATASDDPRLQLPPDKGFGGSGGDQVGQQIAAQAMAVPALAPADSTPAKLAATDDLFSWLKETVPMGNLPRGTGRQSKPAPGFVEMPDGRAVGLSQAAIDAAPSDTREWIRGALQGPSEVWAAPYLDPKGNVALVISALLGVGDRVLCVPVVAGCVPATGLTVRYLTDPREARRGGRIS
jgi:SPP1 gp7 family putative phage head morphogenesis protein